MQNKRCKCRCESLQRIHNIQYFSTLFQGQGEAVFIKQNSKQRKHFPATPMAVQRIFAVLAYLGPTQNKLQSACLSLCRTISLGSILFFFLLPVVDFNQIQSTMELCHREVLAIRLFSEQTRLLSWVNTFLVLVVLLSF